MCTEGMDSCSQMTLQKYSAVVWWDHLTAINYICELSLVLTYSQNKLYVVHFQENDQEIAWQMIYKMH